MTININGALYGSTINSGSVIHAQFFKGAITNLQYCSQECPCNSRGNSSSGAYCSCNGDGSGIACSCNGNYNRSNWYNVGTLSGISSGSVINHTLFSNIINKIAQIANLRNNAYFHNLIAFNLGYNANNAYSGMTISASYINTIINDINRIVNTCSCNCNYCTCNCNYCTCNCNYCPCNCSY
jgi:hypothetical protein